jgi:pseudoazurin
MIDKGPMAVVRTGALAALSLVAALGVAAGAARAAEHIVRLITEDEDGRFRFEPALLLAQPGDAVRFEPDSRMHAVKSVPGMLPERVKPWRSRMGEAMVVRLEKPGVYGLKCPAHYQVGMVGLILVGERPANWHAARAVRHPPMTSEVFAQLFAQAACRLGPDYRADCHE